MYNTEERQPAAKRPRVESVLTNGLHPDHINTSESQNPTRQMPICLEVDSPCLNSDCQKQDDYTKTCSNNELNKVRPLATVDLPLKPLQSPTVLDDGLSNNGRPSEGILSPGLNSPPCDDAFGSYFDEALFEDDVDTGWEDNGEKVCFGVVSFFYLVRCQILIVLDYWNSCNIRASGLTGTSSIIPSAVGFIQPLYFEGISLHSWQNPD
jgi:hypothetical protein